MLYQFALAVLISSYVLPEHQVYNPDKVDECIAHASTFYWLGMAESGDLEAYSNGLEYLDIALDYLETREVNLPIADRQYASIDALRQDIEEQIGLSGDTFYGLFPLIRLLTGTVFSDPSKLGTYELFDDPHVIAATVPATEVAQEVLIQWSAMTDPCFDVVFVSVPYRPDLENEVLYIFNQYPQYFVHNYNVLVVGLDQAIIDSLYLKNPTPSLIATIMNELNLSSMLLVSVNKLDETNGICFYQIDASLYNSNLSTPQPAQTISRMGFSRDRNDRLVPIIASNVFLLLLGCFVFIILFRLFGNYWPSLDNVIKGALASWFFGRFFPWILLPMLKSIAPPNETLVHTSFWWPALVGLSLITLSVFIYRVIAKRLSFLNLVSYSEHPIEISGTLATGISAYFAGPMLILQTQLEITVLIPVFISIIVPCVILGRTFSKPPLKPKFLYAVPYAMSMLSGLTLLHADPSYLWLLSTVYILMLLPFFHTYRRCIASDEECTHSNVNTRIESIDDLLHVVRNPSYIEYDYYRHCENCLSPFLEGRTVHLGLFAERGSGKSATAERLIVSLKDERPTVVLRGMCSEPIGQGEPYAAYKSILEYLLGLDLKTRSEDAFSGVDSVLDTVVSGFMPFSELLLPQEGMNQEGTSSKNQMYSSVVKALKQLLKKSGLIIYIDDVHWMDDASRDLTRFIASEFAVDAPHRIAFIFASRYANDLSEIGLSDESMFEIPALNNEEKIELLCAGLGFSLDTARSIVEKVVGSSKEFNNLFWLYKTVETLADNNVFKIGEGGLEISDEYVNLSNLPIPKEYANIIKDKLNRSKTCRKILECAACIGFEFSISLLSQALDRARLEVLQDLREIEEETGLLSDKKDNDDFYAFSSTFVLELIRDRSGITGNGFKDTDVPQIVREYHFRIASALEDRAKEDPSKIFWLADQYYAAGRSAIKEAMRYSIEAATMASAVFSHNQAIEYIRRSRECMEALAFDLDTERRILLIECREAYISGNNRPDVLLRSTKFVRDHRDTSLDLWIAIGELSYKLWVDTGRGSEEYSALAVKFARQTIENSESSLRKAQAYHLLGNATQLKNRIERLDHLFKAEQLVQDTDTKSNESMKMLGIIYNSIAEELSYRVEDDLKKKAIEYFEKSIEIKSKPQIMDKHGLALAHGGIGRIYLFSDSPDIDIALIHFQEDLKLSCDVGDMTGQAKMNSLIGQCYLQKFKSEDNIESINMARDHYLTSYRYSISILDKLFATAGLLRTSALLLDGKGIECILEEVLGIVEAKEVIIPEYCARELRDAFNEYSKVFTNTNDMARIIEIVTMKK